MSVGKVQSNKEGIKYSQDYAVKNHMSGLQIIKALISRSWKSSQNKHESQNQTCPLLPPFSVFVHYTGAALQVHPYTTVKSLCKRSSWPKSRALLIKATLTQNLYSISTLSPGCPISLGFGNTLPQYKSSRVDYFKPDEHIHCCCFHCLLMHANVFQCMT